MTYSRSHLVDPAGGVYHVCSRCVRRAFLCGKDKFSDYNFDHRRVWIENRILELSKIFPIDIFGYAVMSNHYHLVLQVNPGEVSQWTDRDIVRKWLALNPRAKERSETQAIRAKALLRDKDRLGILRERLSSLSWFMRYLNEPLARLANKEDGCKGRFWEGRFKSQRLLDEDAILACMVYVDLNPVRAKLVKDIVNAEHTSLSQRLDQEADINKKLAVINKPELTLPFTLTLKEYIQLGRWTTEAQQSNRPTKFESVPPPDFRIIERMPKPGCWQRALGSVQALKKYASDLGQHWIRTSSA